MKELYLLLLLLKYQKQIFTFMIITIIVFLAAAVVLTRKCREETEPSGRYTKKQAEKERK